MRVVSLLVGVGVMVGAGAKWFANVRGVSVFVCLVLQWGVVVGGKGSYKVNC